MILLGNFDTARPKRQAVTILTGDVFGRTDILAGQAEGSPHAYLVEQSPDVSLPPHFHLTEQFQIVVAGSGMLGRSHLLAPITIHYARAKTGYGPIVAGPDGLSYLTLRPRVEYGGHYLSDPKTRIDREAPKLQATSAHVPLTQMQNTAGIENAAQTTLLEPGVGRPAAWLSRLMPADLLEVPANYGPTGRFYVVASGNASVAGETLPPWSCIWEPAGERLASIKAGAQGAEIITLQFPDNRPPPAPVPSSSTSS